VAALSIPTRNQTLELVIVYLFPKTLREFVPESGCAGTEGTQTILTSSYLRYFYRICVPKIIKSFVLQLKDHVDTLVTVC